MAFTESEQNRTMRAVFSDGDKLEATALTDNLKTPFLYQNDKGEPIKSTPALLEECKRYWKAITQ